LQYVQKEKGILDILLIKGEGFLDIHEQKIRDYYRSKFCVNTQINIKYVDKLLRKSNGKFVELISEVKE
jgi:phenylacetate-CoA ligase